MPLPDPHSLLKISPVIPVITVQHLDDAVPLARALVLGGLSVLEITLRTDAAIDAIARIRTEVPQAIVGAGTILSTYDMDRALRAGAAFLVSPGTTPKLAKAFLDAPVPVLPGCATVSEAMILSEMGFKALKLFPAEAMGGIKLLKAMAGPLPHLRFCPTGGIDAQKAAEYLDLASVVCVGGSWMCSEHLIKAQDFTAITHLAGEASALRLKKL